jgi:hypothetical protein
MAAARCCDVASTQRALASVHPSRGCALRNKLLITWQDARKRLSWYKACTSKFKAHFQMWAAGGAPINFVDLTMKIIVMSLWSRRYGRVVVKLVPLGCHVIACADLGEARDQSRC